MPSSVYRFIFVGVGTVFINLSSFLLLSKLNSVHTSINIAISFFCGLAFNYALNCKYTFQSKTSLPRVLGYGGLVTFNLAINYLFVIIFWNIFELEAFYGVLFSAVVLPPMNFIVMNHLFKSSCPVAVSKPEQ